MLRRDFPAASMSGLMSDIVTLLDGGMLGWERRRRAMSPVPPAMSRIFIGAVSCAGSGDAGDEGRSERTKWSFQSRWMESDMRSFMVSYDVATEEKTVAQCDAHARNELSGTGRV